MSKDGVSEFVVVPAPGDGLFSSGQIEAAIIEVPRFVEEIWALLREPGETRRDVFVRLGREVERGPLDETVVRTRYGVHRPISTEEP